MIKLNQNNSYIIFNVNIDDMDKVEIKLKDSNKVYNIQDVSSMKETYKNNINPNNQYALMNKEGLPYGMGFVYKSLDQAKEHLYKLLKYRFSNIVENGKNTHFSDAEISINGKPIIVNNNDTFSIISA